MQSVKAAASGARARSWLLLVFAVPGSVSASNGLNLIGFGTEFATMRAADVAVARDSRRPRCQSRWLEAITHAGLGHVLRRRLYAVDTPC